MEFGNFIHEKKRNRVFWKEIYGYQSVCLSALHLWGVQIHWSVYMWRTTRSYKKRVPLDEWIVLGKGALSSEMHLLGNSAWLMVLAQSLNEDNEVVLLHMFTGAFSVAWKATWDKTQGCLLEKETNWLINFAFLAVLAGWVCFKKSKRGFLFYI